MRRSLLVPLLALLAVTGLPASADATPPCVEYWTYGEYASLLPQQQETGVPTDTLVWFSVDGAFYPDDDRFPEPVVALTDEAGDEVPVELHGVLVGTSTRTYAWRPTTELAALAAYDVSVVWFDDEDEIEDQPESGTHSSYFVTGEGPSSGAPATPAITRLDLETYGNEFPGSQCYNLPLQDRATVSMTTVGRLNVVFMADEANQDGPVDPFAADADSSVARTIDLTGELPPATRLRIRAGSYDLAGNFSGWTAEQNAAMPAAGCSSTKTFDQAALGLALLLVGGGLLRRRDLTRLLPVLLAGAFGLAALTPATASAEETTETIQAAAPTTAAAATVEPDFHDWRAPIAARLLTAEKVFGGLTLGGAGVQLGFTLALPFRAPGALSGTVGSALGWAPALSGLITTAALRHSLLRTVSAERLEASLWVGYGVTVGLTVAGITLAGIGGTLTTIFTDSNGGIFAAMMGGALSILSMNVTMGVTAGQLKRLRVRGAPTTTRLGRPAPQLLAAGPTGLILAF
jgi:hypothetical protein